MSSALESAIIMPVVMTVMLSSLCVFVNLADRASEEADLEIMAAEHISRNHKLYDCASVSDENKNLKIDFIGISTTALVENIDLVKDISYSVKEITSLLKNISGQDNETVAK